MPDGEESAAQEAIVAGVEALRAFGHLPPVAEEEEPVVWEEVGAAVEAADLPVIGEGDEAARVDAILARPYDDNGYPYGYLEEDALLGAVQEFQNVDEYSCSSEC